MTAQVLQIGTYFTRRAENHYQFEKVINTSETERNLNPPSLYLQIIIPRQ